VVDSSGYDAGMPDASALAFEQEIGAQLTRGDLAAAAGTAAVCRNALPAARAGWLLGSIVALMDMDRERALALIEEYLSREPTDAQCLLQKAECLLAMGEHAAAAEAADS